MIGYIVLLIGIILSSLNTVWLLTAAWTNLDFPFYIHPIFLLPLFILSLIVGLVEKRFGKNKARAKKVVKASLIALAVAIVLLLIVDYIVYQATLGQMD